MTEPMHLVLCGDSLFQNRNYVQADEPAVVGQLSALLPGSSVTCLAEEGTRTEHVLDQLVRLPPRTTHILLSVGGNDALGAFGRLDAAPDSPAAVLEVLYEIGAHFRASYAAVLDGLARYAQPLVTSTIPQPQYDAHPDPNDPGGAGRQPAQKQRLALAFLSTFNDVILHESVARGLPVADLRFACKAASDFANAIAISGPGGLNIARLLAHVVQTHDFGRGDSVVYRVADIA